MKKFNLLLLTLAFLSSLNQAFADGREGGGRQRQQQQQQQACETRAIRDLVKLNRKLLHQCPQPRYLPATESTNHGLDYKIIPLSAMAQSLTRMRFLKNKSEMRTNFIKLGAYVEALDPKDALQNESCILEAKELYHSQVKDTLKETLKNCYQIEL